MILKSVVLKCFDLLQYEKSFGTTFIKTDNAEQQNALKSIFVKILQQYNGAVSLQKSVFLKSTSFKMILYQYSILN